MQNLIYYPTFEPTDIDWLKFALIYIDRFSPIIPDRGQSGLSDTFRIIKENTELISIHKPEWSEGDNATTKVIREIEFIKQFPQLQGSTFGGADIINTWRNREEWHYIVYEEKYSSPFKGYCLLNEFAEEVPDGIIMSKELAMFFMAFLAEEIAFRKGAHPITDIVELDSISTYARAKNPANEMKLQAVKTLVGTAVPSGLSAIPVEKFIAFRQDSGINELRGSFNRSLDSYYDSLEQGFDPEAYIKTIKKTNNELIKELGLFFGGLVSTGISGSILLKNPDQLELVKQLIEGTMLGIGGVASIHGAIKGGKDKRNARKFLTRIRTLSGR